MSKPIVQMRNCLLWMPMLIMVFAAGCGPAKYVDPLEKGRWSASGTLGGPIFENLGYPIPIPLLAVGAGYGLTNRITLFTDIKVTEATFGVIHLNVGGTYYINKPEGVYPGLSTTLILNNAISTWDGAARIWPQADFVARWPYGKRQNIWYAGVNNFFEPAGEKAHDRVQEKHWIPAIMAGHVFTGEKWDINLEGKFIAPFTTNHDVAVEYIGAGTNGVFGIYAGFIRKF